MRDVGERAAVNERRVAFKGLDQVRIQGVVQECGQGSFHAQVADLNRPAVLAATEHDVAQAP